MTTHIDASVVHDVIVSKRVATYILNRVFLQKQDLLVAGASSKMKLRVALVERLFFVEIGVSIRFYIMVLLYVSEDSVNPIRFFGFGNLTG